MSDDGARAVLVIRNGAEAITVEDVGERVIARAALVSEAGSEVWILTIAGRPDARARTRRLAMEWCIEVAQLAGIAALELAAELAERAADDAAPAPTIN